MEDVQQISAVSEFGKSTAAVLQVSKQLLIVWDNIHPSELYRILKTLSGDNITVTKLWVEPMRSDSHFAALEFPHKPFELAPLEEIFVNSKYDGCTYTLREHIEGMSLCMYYKSFISEWLPSEIVSILVAFLYRVPT